MVALHAPPRYRRGRIVNTRSLIAAAVVTTLALCNQAHAQEDGEPEVTELEGTWEVVSHVISGRTYPQELIAGLPWRFEENRWYKWRSDGEGWHRAGTFFLDPVTMPAEIDLTRRRFNFPGIYELDGDSLTICLCNPGESRPDAFESTEDNGAILYTLRRVTEEDEE